MSLGFPSNPTTGDRFLAANGIEYIYNGTAWDGSIGGAQPDIPAALREVPLGTALEPSFAFAGDPDTGFFSPGANQIGASTGGVRRWLLSNTAFQVDVPITGTAVQTNAVDAAVNKIMKTGAFGLGSLNLSDAVLRAANADNFDLPAGFYNTDGSTTGVLPAIAGGVGTLLVFPFATSTGPNANQTYQMWFPLQRLSEFYFRSYRNPTWGDWQRAYSPNNVVGTVAQTGGVPTAGIIERGSNANGEYVRFADGTQICTGQSPTFAVDNLVGAVYKSAPQALAFPASFISVPHCGGSIENTLNSWCNIRASNSSNWQITGWSFQSRATDVVKVYAIGRWF